MTRKRDTSLEHPTPEMIDAGVSMLHQPLRYGPPETLVHDIWQSMYDARPRRRASLKESTIKESEPEHEGVP